MNKYSTGRLITRATNDAAALNEMFTDVFVSLFKDIVLIIGIIVAMFQLDRNLALIGLTAVPFIALVTYYFRSIIRRNFKLVKSLIGQINGFLAENLSGMKLVQVFNREIEKQREFKELNEKYNEATIFQIKLNSVLRPIIEMLQMNSNISDEEIVKAIDLSYSRDLINELPKGIDEPVRERGSTFSTGQRQLLSFARAIAHNPSILVLDEATANIDTKTELMIQKSIDSISKNRTTLIIAHRLSTIRQADKIIVLDKGRIMEMGNHDELLNNGRYYRELYEAQ